MPTYEFFLYGYNTAPIGTFQIIQAVSGSLSVSDYTLNFKKSDNTVVSNIPIETIETGTGGATPLANNNLKLTFKTSLDPVQYAYDWFNEYLLNDGQHNSARVGPNGVWNPIDMIFYILNLNPNPALSTLELQVPYDSYSTYSLTQDIGNQIFSQLSLIAPPISNICFLSGTPITTDQGQVAIDRINPSVHTIRSMKIVAVTQTVTDDTHLIQLDKGLLANNIPSQDTIISKFHKVLYKGEMICAKDVPGAKKIAYEGQFLYNVLLDNYEKMIVNNLIVDTLHPRNRVAILSRYILKNKPDAAKINKLVAIHNRR